MTERISLSVDDGVSGKLTEIAGGERRRGRWLSDVVNAAYENRAIPPSSSDVETLRLTVVGLSGEVQMLEGRLLRAEQQLAALMASEVT